MMRKTISNQFFLHYLVVFVLVAVATVSAYFFLIIANHLAEDTFTKNRYPASAMMRDDYRFIDPAPILKNGGSLQIVDKDYRVVVAEGKDALPKRQLTPAEFTEFLVESKSKDRTLSHDILYNPQGEFWLIITFPTSFRIDFEVKMNPKAATGNFPRVAFIFGLTIAIYLLLLTALTIVYSRITGSRITESLRKLRDGTRLLREGDYSARVDLRLTNEFAELQDTFNDMASRIEEEIDLRKKSEGDRRQLILDISHDLKNPMASIQGYAERLLHAATMSEEERRGCLEVIQKNSQRANRLLTELFELSQMDSPEFSLHLEATDLCEVLRQICGELVQELERAGFDYEFAIPEEPVWAWLDIDRFGRVVHNLADNAVRYNPRGTTVSVSLTVTDDQAMIHFSDNGIGIPTRLKDDIFKPFVRADYARTFETGGSGLGLAIAKRITEAHGGDVVLCSSSGKGSTFRMTIPTI